MKIFVFCNVHDSLRRFMFYFCEENVLFDRLTFFFGVLSKMIFTPFLWWVEEIRGQMVLVSATLENEKNLVFYGRIFQRFDWFSPDNFREILFKCALSSIKSVLIRNFRAQILVFQAKFSAKILKKSKRHELKSPGNSNFSFLIRLTIRLTQSSDQSIFGIF